MKKIILDFRVTVNNLDELVQESFNMNFFDVLVSKETFSRFNAIGKVIKYAMDPRLKADVHIFQSREDLDADEVVNVSHTSQIGLAMDIADKKDLGVAIELCNERIVDMIIIRAKNWKVIPFENLIAETEGSTTQIIAHVGDLNEAALMLKTLELGVDGVLIRPKSVNDIVKLKKLTRTRLKIELELAKVTDIQAISESERVCVDTTSLLSPGEGMLVGSTAKGFVLIHAEVFETQFISSRPFRVNAGDVSAYILVPSKDSSENYRTKYLSEIEGGDNVFAVDHLGNARIVTVGRVKIETRPMLRFLFEILRDSETIKIGCICQNAETINLVDSNGKAISVVNVRKGEEFLVHVGPGATHSGAFIREKIIEK